MVICWFSNSIFLQMTSVVSHTLDTLPSIKTLMVSWVTVQQKKSWCKVRPGNRGKCIKESNDHACNNVQLLLLLLHIRTFPNGISGFQSWSSLDSVSDKVCSKCCTPFVLTCVCWSFDADFCFRAWQYVNHLQKSVFTTE